MLMPLIPIDISAYDSAKAPGSRSGSVVEPKASLAPLVSYFMEFEPMFLGGKNIFGHPGAY
jgi:hypothetical protein